MNTTNKIILSLLTLGLCSFTSVASYAQASSITLGVSFGTVPAGGGECVGKGVCDCAVAGSNSLNVTFQVSADNSNVLVMTFSLSDLKNAQPAEAQLFTAASGSYPFDVAYSLSNQLFLPLGLPSGAQITPSSNSTVVINGDVVTDYITMSTGD